MSDKRRILIQLDSDPHPSVFDRDDLWEVAWAVRPAWFATDRFHLIGEVNLQYARPNGLLEETGKQETPVVFQFGLMPSISLGKGSYARPQLRLIYTATVLNPSARLTYAREDELRARRVQQFFGVGVEWWFNSSTRGN